MLWDDGVLVCISWIVANERYQMNNVAYWKCHQQKLPTWRNRCTYCIHVIEVLQDKQHSMEYITRTKIAQWFAPIEFLRSVFIIHNFTQPNHRLLEIRTPSLQTPPFTFHRQITFNRTHLTVCWHVAPVFVGSIAGSEAATKPIENRSPSSIYLQT